MHTPRHPTRSITIMASVLLALFLLSFVLGRYGVPLGEVVKILLSRVFPIEQTWTDNMAIAVWNVRLPRILLACLVGCGLSTAGTAYQTVFQNPMAAPDILGASSGACFGAALAILTGQSTVMVTVFAFLASLLRNIFGLGSLLAFPGSMCGALLCGLVYWKTKNIFATMVGEVFGTSILGGLCAYPVAIFLMGKSAGDIAFYAYIVPFLISTAVGSIIAGVLVYSLQRSGALRSMQNSLS